MAERTESHETSKQEFIDFHEMLAQNNEYDFRWCYRIKEVDRRLSYPLVKKSWLICDVGGAQGVDSFAFAQRGAFVINLDVNGYSLVLGNRRAQELGLKANLSFIEASATALPFRPELFNLITCFSTLDHLPSKESAYGAILEFSRVVSKQGYVVITVPNSLFLIGTISMRVKKMTEPEAFPEQRFTPKELSHILCEQRLRPISFDSEFPRIPDRSILVFHFPKLFRKMPGMMQLVTWGARVFDRISGRRLVMLFGARFGYLSKKI